MGIQGLWQLLEPGGARIPIESLATKVLAVDASIWLVQFVKAMRDDAGRMLPNAHVLGSLRRIMRLLFQHVRPVFVFDGATPALKRRTLNERKRARGLAEFNVNKTAQKLVLNELKRQRLAHTALGDQHSGYSSSAPGFQAAPTTAAATPVVLAKRSRSEWGGDAPPSESEEEPGSDDDVPFVFDADCLDFGALKSLPSTMQMKAILQAKRQKAQQARSEYRRLRGGAKDFSASQISHFLNSAHFNVKVEHHIKSIATDDTEGRRMDGDESKNVVLTYCGKESRNSLEAVKQSLSLPLGRLRGVDEATVSTSLTMDAILAGYNGRPVNRTGTLDVPQQSDASASSGDPWADSDESDTAGSVEADCAWGTASGGGQGLLTAAHKGVHVTARGDWSDRCEGHMAGLGGVHETAVESAMGASIVTPGGVDGAREAGEGVARESGAATEAAGDGVGDDMQVSTPVTNGAAGRVLLERAGGASHRGTAADGCDEGMGAVEVAPPISSEEPAVLEAAREAVAGSVSVFNAPSGAKDGSSFATCPVVNPTSGLDPLTARERKVATRAQAERDLYVLAQEDAALRAEYNRASRDADAVTDEMVEDVVELLSLFGLPYVVAPMEAEAQCATLEQLGLVDGIITNDSDVFAFGGQRVYKNFFEAAKYTEVYSAERLRKTLGLDTNGFITMAELLGSDYALGIKGVGIVNAQEIIACFGPQQKGLQAFKEWLESTDVDPRRLTPKEVQALPPDEQFKYTHRHAKTRWHAPDSFPSRTVREAYLRPVVDRSTEPFTWDTPNMAGLRVFVARKLGWPPEKLDQEMQPVLDAIHKKQKQRTLIDWVEGPAGVMRSERLRRATKVVLGKRDGTMGSQDETNVARNDT